MHIKEVIIDGFKSYAQRTVVAGFDPLFNAITGLNGSGKSNILDAICFVLGISNLSQVRAGSLQELVYKQGQAGVSRASVTLVFNNEDKNGSPVGYEQHDELTVTRQVVIGGRNKYLVNGYNAQPSRVQNLFHSVQLNVNNPHFLIMQGRITKVLNMKPAETLSMIEEAAGTRMFETKKIAARKTMEKKEHKITEINALLEENITPTLEKLRKERSSYLEFQKTKTEIEHLERYVGAYNFYQAEGTLESSTTELKSLDASQRELKTVAAKSGSEAENLKQNVAILEKKRDTEMGSVLKELESKSGDASKHLIKDKAAWDHKKEARVAEESNLEGIKKTVETAGANIEKKLKAVKLAEDKLEKAQADLTVCKATFEEEEKRCDAIALGMTADAEGETKTFADQLKDTENAISTAETEAQQAKMKLDHSKKELKVKAPTAKKSEQAYAKQSKQLTKMESSVEAAQAKLDALKYDPTMLPALEKEFAANSTELDTVRDKVDTLQARLSRMQFSYSDPERGFDRSKVSGLVADLITVKDSEAATALEITAGSKLFNVVVDTEVTGKKLLSKGKLRSRVTIIPLNKITRSIVNDKVVSLAKREVGAENANLALSLVGFDDEVSAAMEYIFGRTLICRDMDMARKVTFNDKIKTRSVTLDGDVFDPQGTLTGGAKSKSSGILTRLSELREAQDRLQQLQTIATELKEKLSRVSASAAQYTELNEEVELKTQEMTLIRTRLEQSTLGQIISEVKALEAAVEENKQLMSTATERVTQGKAHLEEIQKEMKDFDSGRDKKIKAAEKVKVKAKEAVVKSRDKVSEATRMHQEVTLEVEAFREEVAASQDQISVVEAAVAQLLEEEAQMKSKVAERKAAFDEAEKELEDKRHKLSAYDTELQDLASSIRAHGKERNDAEIALKKLDFQKDKLQKEKKVAAQVVERMLVDHPWIAADRQYFGQAGSVFDFNTDDKSRDPKECKRRLASLQGCQEKLSKNVNMKVLSMFDKAVKEYNDLLKKKKIVEEDKAKIDAAIHELDEKKNDVLTKAHEQVNKDFGSIFSTLLPGTNAKLMPMEGKSILEGLDIKIAFGDVWKESLTELSGGQRSLVALSLILSLLLFKPAPLYILDEVDAALDLSHTQNIGQMLRTHFNKSQFVVVSLKDGMFNNANVLFKTKFVDGVSTVRRYAQSTSTSTAGKENSKASKSSARPSKRARGGRARAVLSANK